MILNVQFADDTEEVIIAYFGSPQDPNFYANLGEVDSSDPRWHAYVDSLPEWIKPMLPAPD